MQQLGRISLHAEGVALGVGGLAREEAQPRAMPCGRHREHLLALEVRPLQQKTIKKGLMKCVRFCCKCIRKRTCARVYNV